MHRLCCVVAGVVLLSAGGCADNPTVPADDGPIQVSVVAATTEIVMSGQEIPVTATVITDRGRPYPNFLLNFNVLEGGGRVFGGAELTNSKGVARDIWTIGFGSCQLNTLAVRAVDAATGAGTTYFTQTVATPGKISFYRKPTGNVSEGAEVYVMNVDGSNQTRLTGNLGNGSFTDWSPDGRRIVYAAPDGLYVMNEDGSNKTRLPNGGGAPAWSPDGKWIAYSGGSGSDVYLMRADGSNRMNLTFTPEYNEGSPDWSPDGSKLVFVSDRDGIGTYELYVMDADGSNQARLTYNSVTEENPAWSHDGSKIAFDAAGPGAGHDIFVMNVDGSDVRNLTNQQGTNTLPDWSPDASQIVFNSNRGVGNDSDIYVMNADGSNPTNLTNVPTMHNARAAWSRCVPF